MRILTIIFIFLSLSSFAQNTNIEVQENNTKATFKRHEVRIIVERFNIGKVESDSYQYNDNLQFLNKGMTNIGVGYNFNFKSFLITSKFSFNKSPINSNINSSSTFIKKTESSLYKVSLGGVYLIRKNKFTFYIGGNFTYFSSSSTLYTFKSETNGYLFEPNIGFKYHLSKTISINPELFFGLGICNSDAKYRLWDSMSGGSFSSSNKVRNAFIKEPLLGNLSINFSF